MRKDARRGPLHRGGMNYCLRRNRLSRGKHARRHRNCRRLLLRIVNGAKTGPRMVVGVVARRWNAAWVRTCLAQIRQVHFIKAGCAARICRVERFASTQRNPSGQRRTGFIGKTRTPDERNHRRRVHRARPPKALESIPSATLDLSTAHNGMARIPMHPHPPKSIPTA